MPSFEHETIGSLLRYPVQIFFVAYLTGLAARRIWRVAMRRLSNGPVAHARARYASA